MLDSETFRTEFVREYLRYIQRKHSTLTGLFFLDDKPIMWGALVEYGPPPQNGLLVEMWPEREPDNYATYRFWYAAMDEAGRYKRKRSIMRDEISKS
jgi:hypothetical protein